MIPPSPPTSPNPLENPIDDKVQAESVDGTTHDWREINCVWKAKVLFWHRQSHSRQLWSGRISYDTRNRSGKGLKTITNPPNHSPVPEALHRSCSILQRSCWGSFVSIQAKSGFFSAVLHSHLLIWVLIPSCACHFNQLWPLPCKKTKVQTLLGFIFPLICVFCGGSVWELNCRLLCVKDESSSLWRDAPGLVSPENLKAPFPRKGPCLLSWGRVKEQKHEISFLLPWSIWPSLWEKLSDSSSLSCNVNTIKSTLAREAVYN